MQGKINLERLLSMSQGMKLGKKFREEIEESLQNLNPRDLEDFEKICSYEKEIKELAKVMIGKTECIDLKMTVAKMISAATLKGMTVDNNDKKKYGKKIKKYVERIQLIIKTREKSAQQAAILVTERYINKKGNDFALPPKTVSKLKSEIRGGLGFIFGGVLGWILGAFGAYSEGSLVVNMGVRFSVGAISLWPAAFFLGGTALFFIGVRKVMEYRKDNKYAKEYEKYQTYLDFCGEMIRIRDEKIEREKLEREKLVREKLEKEKPQVILEKVIPGCNCSLRKY